MTLILYRRVILNCFPYLSKPKIFSIRLHTLTEIRKGNKNDDLFNEKEKILVNNVLICLLNDYNWTTTLTHNGIPSFFVRNNEFRTNLIEYLDKSREFRGFFRENIGNFISNEKNNVVEPNSAPNKLIKHIQSFVSDNMPSLILACNNFKHLVDFRHFGTENSNSSTRSVHLHIGPPNSGKTHEAISRLAGASTGIYCSPLRLLAWEMYNRLNNSNVPCSLITGQERVDNNENHLSCTVEMIPFDRTYEVAVLDEMQMIADLTRGYAWTKAFFEIKAKEIHVCGSQSCLEIMKKLTNLRGDLLQITEHERLGNLKTLENVVTVDDLEPGDSVVCFSRSEVFNLRDQIESNSYYWNLKRQKEDVHSEKDRKPTITSVIYGSLPPETRYDQLEAFNKRETKILISSDVIGMGVNVSIRRIIFHRLKKYDGNEPRSLTVSEIHQISGRAGRYGLECGEGQVSCMREKDLMMLKELIQQEPPQIDKAVISPNLDIFEALYSSLNQATGLEHSLSDVTKLLTSISQTGKSFIMCDFFQIKTLAKCLEGISLPFEVLKHYLMVPVGSTLSTLVVRAFAASHHLLNSVKISNIISKPSLDLDFDKLNSMSINEEIKKLELFYEVLDIYTWLSNKFPSVYVDKSSVLELKGRVSSSLSKLLREASTEKTSEEPSEGELTKDIIRAEFLIPN